MRNKLIILSALDNTQLGLANRLGGVRLGIDPNFGCATVFYKEKSYPLGVIVDGYFVLP